MSEVLTRAGRRIAGARGTPAAVLAVACTCQFIIAIDYNIVFVALPTIGSELNIGSSGLQWVVTAYTVAVGGVLILGGRLSDRVGSRRILMAGMALYGLGCLISAVGADAFLLILGRFVQGTGAGLATPASLALIYAAFSDPAERHRALGGWGAATAIGLAAGSALGGVLTGLLGWPSVFWVNTVFAVLAIALAAALLPPDALARWNDFDVFGAILATIGSVLIIYSLASIPEAGFFSLAGGGALVAGIVVGAVWLRWERSARSPLFPPRAARDRGFLGVAIALMAAQGMLGAGYYEYTEYLQDRLGWGAVSAGLGFLPLAVVSIVLSRRAVPGALNRFGPARVVTACFTGSALAFLALSVAYAAGAGFAIVLSIMLVWAVACAYLFPAAMALLGHLPISSELPGVISAAGSSARQIGAGIGLALAVIASRLVDGTGFSGTAAACATIAAICLVGLAGAVVAERAARTTPQTVGIGG
ncbi:MULTISPECIES: MFS transporter [Tsukamurella]|uniref:MFS transporter n=1 Tax=Tsukamurella strandjordii TaxID=147577 RepID=A0AA90NCU7_9ACTN|nr:MULTISPECIES: MFS transporter [Tsukamurella]MDP0400157.1 MFS transporter [Tsukamurella strandjordii]GIZ97158.1 MFS transporter [Tsukamurella sp. TY48]